MTTSSSPISRIESQAAVLSMAYGHHPEMGDQARLLTMLCEPVSNFDNACHLIDTIGSYNGFMPERVKKALKSVWDDVSSVSIGRENSPVMFVDLEIQWDDSTEERRETQERVAAAFDTAEERSLYSSAHFSARHICSLETNLSHYNDEAQEQIKAQQDECERNPFNRTIRLWWD